MSRVIAYILLVATMIGCQSEQPTEPDGAAVEFSACPMSRVEGGEWERGDKIGVFMYGEAVNEIYAENVAYSTDGATPTLFTATGTPIYYPNTGERSFIAYYPYSATATADNIPIDISDQSGCVDMLLSSVERGERGDLIGFTFLHLLSSVEVEISSQNDLSSLKVYAKNVVTKASYNLLTSELTPNNELSDMEMIVEGSKARAILIPHSGATVFEFVIGDQRYRASTSVALVGGHSYKFALNGILTSNEE